VGGGLFDSIIGAIQDAVPQPIPKSTAVPCRLKSALLSRGHTLPPCVWFTGTPRGCPPPATPAQGPHACFPLWIPPTNTCSFTFACQDVAILRLKEAACFISGTALHCLPTARPPFLPGTRLSSLTHRTPCPPFIYCTHLLSPHCELGEGHHSPFHRFLAFLQAFSIRQGQTGRWDWAVWDSWWFNYVGLASYAILLLDAAAHCTPGAFVVRWWFPSVKQASQTISLTIQPATRAGSYILYFRIWHTPAYHLPPS